MKPTEWAVCCSSSHRRRIGLRCCLQSVPEPQWDQNGIMKGQMDSINLRMAGSAWNSDADHSYKTAAVDFGKAPGRPHLDPWVAPTRQNNHQERSLSRSIHSDTACISSWESSIKGPSPLSTSALISIFARCRVRDPGTIHESHTTALKQIAILITHALIMH